MCNPPRENRSFAFSLKEIVRLSLLFRLSLLIEPATSTRMANAQPALPTLGGSRGAKGSITLKNPLASGFVHLAASPSGSVC